MLCNSVGKPQTLDPFLVLLVSTLSVNLVGKFNECVKHGSIFFWFGLSDSMRLAAHGKVRIFAVKATGTPGEGQYSPLPTGNGVEARIALDSILGSQGLLESQLQLLREGAPS